MLNNSYNNGVGSAYFYSSKYNLFKFPVSYKQIFKGVVAVLVTLI